MGKKKAILATLTAATLALGCGAFVACGGHTHTYSDKWDSNAEGHWHSATCDDLKEGDKDYTNGYAAHVWGDDNECDVCHYIKTEQGGEHTHSYTEWGKSDTEHWKYCAADNEIDESTRAAHNYVEGVCECGQEDPNAGGGEVTEEYTITLSVGAGTLPAGAALTYTTVGGKLNVTLPEAEIATAHWSFDNWYDAEEGGNAIVEATTVFTEDTTIYARYVRDTGLWVGDTFLQALEVNTGCTDHLQYWINGRAIELEKDTVVSAYVDGELMEYTIFQSSSCIVVPASSAKVTSVTVSEDANFTAIFLNKWGEGNWQMEYTGAPLHVEGADEIPDGCEAITLKFSNGDVTLYIINKSG
ncbi:MAG: hypothetical protein K2K12_04100 [Clostridia bacterium]|nr:hypothetical protein [Clostridia bacterium]